MGVLAQNDLAQKNQAGLASNKAEAAAGYKGYGVTPGAGGFQAPPKPFVSTDPNAGQPSSFAARMAKVAMGKIAQVGITAKMIADGKNPTAFKNAAAENNKNNAQITSNVNALKQGGGVGGDVTKVAQGVLHGARTLAGGIASGAEDIGQQAKKTVTNLASPAATSKQRQSLISNQAAAQKNPEYLKAVSDPSLKMSTVPAQAGVEAQKMAADGAKATQISEYLKVQSQKLSSQTKRGVGDFVQVASLAVGGGEAKGIVKGGEEATNVVKQTLAKKAVGLVKDTSKIGAAGAAGNAGATLSSNPNASGKTIAKSAAEGYAGGVALGVGGKIIGKGVALLRKAPVDTAKIEPPEEAPKTAGQKLLNPGKTVTKSEPKQLTAGGQVETTGKNAATLKSYTPSTTKNERVTAGSNPGVVAHDIEPVTKETNPAKRDAVIKQAALDHADSTLRKVDSGELSMSPEDRKEVFKTRQDIANGKVEPMDTLPDNHPVKVAYADAGAPNKASIEAPAPKPQSKTTKAPQLKPEMLPDTNRPAAKGVSGLINRAANKTRSAGKFNPVDRVAAEGHTDFADNTRSIAGAKEGAIRQGNLDSDKFDTLYSNYLRNGGTHEQFIKDVESGDLKTEAHQHFAKIGNDTGKQLASAGVTKGYKENYVGRSAEFPNVKNSLGGSGLKKSGSFSKSRETVTDEFGNSSDKYATHADFKKAVEESGGKVLSDPRDILRHTLPSKYEAIENAKGLSKLEKTQMADGRPAIVSVGSKGTPREFSDYHAVDGLQGRVVHPDAVPTMKALTHTYTQDEINNPIRKANSLAKKIITLNGLVHGKNFALGSLRKQGLARTVNALAHSDKDIVDRFGEPLIKRAITKGGLMLYGNGKTNTFDVLGNTGDAQSKNFRIPFSGLHEKVNNILFNKVGNHLQLSTYQNAEKGFLKQGFSEDESARLAGDVAKKVAFNSSSVESSVEYRKTSGLVAFAGQYLKSTLNEMARASGVARDNTLSGAAQRAAQKDAIKGIARGMTYLLGAAQAINYSTTGHSTFQNKDSKISPVFYIDKTTGKEYHISNFYGQLGDMVHLLGNPVKEGVNKSSPIIQETSRIINAIGSGAPDPFTGQTVINKNASGARQTGEAIGNFLENMVSPAGVQLSSSGKSIPASVRAAQLFGYGASTTDQNPLEKSIAQMSGAAVPSGVPQPSAQMQTLEATARNDLAKGKTNSPAVQGVKAQMSSTQFKAFMKTGADNTTQREFDKLSTQQKIQIVQKYSPAQLKELDLTGLAKSLVGSDAKTVQATLSSKGTSTQQIQAALQKVGINSSQLQSLKAQAKKQASASRKVSAKEPKFSNPLL